MSALAIEPNLPLYQSATFTPPEIQQRIAEITAAVSTSSLILAPLLGAVAGWFGWLLGIVIRGDDNVGAVVTPFLLVAAACPGGPPKESVLSELWAAA